MEEPPAPPVLHSQGTCLPCLAVLGTWPLFGIAAGDAPLRFSGWEWVAAAGLT